MKITFTDTQGQGGSLYEFKVYGAPVLLSQGKTATASSVYSASYDAAKAVDGDAGSRWAQASGAADPSWLKVDLGDQYQISSVNTSAYLLTGLGVKYKIEYSTDDSTYSMYADKTGSFSTPGVDTKAGSVTARYMKITFTDTQGQGGSLYEFKV
ncbi:discoidin domain-containing protein, partial [Streptomyces sp. HNM0663]